MKKIIVACLFLTSMTSLQSIAYAAEQEVSEVSEPELKVVMSVVCSASQELSGEDIVAAIKKQSTVSWSSEKLDQLQEVGLQLQSVPSQDKQVLCQS